VYFEVQDLQQLAQIEVHDSYAMRGIAVCCVMPAILRGAMSWRHPANAGLRSQISCVCAKQHTSASRSPQPSGGDCRGFPRGGSPEHDGGYHETEKEQGGNAKANCDRFHDPIHAGLLERMLSRSGISALTV
jgi:hypothetical protein